MRHHLPLAVHLQLEQVDIFILVLFEWLVVVRDGQVVKKSFHLGHTELFRARYT